MSPQNQDSGKINKIIADARREQEQRDKSYRGQALKIFPPICSHCGREFSGKRLKELTVHHKDGDHNNNPPDGSNWDLLCLYCHDNEHSRSLTSHGRGMQISGGDASHFTHRPFENLKALLGDEEPKDIAYRSMQQGEEKAACSLVTRVFNSFVAPQYSQEGIDEFLKFADPDAMTARIRANHFVIVAETKDTIVGIIEMRDCEHICLLFVDEAFHRRGIARELLRKALETCARNHSGQAVITVNSSPNSVEAYHKLGFRPSGPEQTKNGIRFVPMTLNI